MISTKNTHKQTHVFLMLVLIAVAAYNRTAPSVSLMGLDETSYAFLTKHMLDGTFLDDPVFYSFHPLYPLITAIVAKLGFNVEFAGRLVSYTIGIGTVIPVYLIGTLCFDETTGFLAGLCCALSSPLISASGRVMSEATYCFLLLAAMFFLVHWMRENRYIYAIAIGTIFALTYLTRAEGFVIFLVVVVIMSAGKKVFGLTSRQMVKTVVIMATSFILFVTPYIYVVKMKGGDQALMSKSATLLKQTAFLIVNGTYENMDSVKTRNIDLFVIVLSEYPESIKRFLSLLPQTFGILPFCLFALGILYSRKLQLPRKYILCVVPFVSVIPMIIFFNFDARHIVPYAPFFFLVASATIVKMDAVFKFKRFRRLPVFMIIFLVMTFGGRLVSLKPAVRPGGTTQYYPAYQHFGREIANRIKPDASVMARYNMAAWYSGGNHQPIPNTVDELLQYAERAQLRYIILGPAEQHMRPEISRFLLSSLKKDGSEGRFRLVHQATYNEIMEFYLLEFCGTVVLGS